MHATLTSKGQLTLPKSARETLGLKAGQRFSTALQSLLDEPAYALANTECMRAALEGYRASSADFGDCLIAADNAAAGCDFTVTFDRAASRLPDVRAL